MTTDLGVGREGAWAELHAAGSTIRYRRRGAGATAVLLPGPGSVAGSDELELALAHAGRLIVPETGPWPEGSPGNWLANFLEGLGVHDALVVAPTGAAVEDALAVAQRAPEMVRGVAILGHPHLSSRIVRAWIETETGSRTPLLLVGFEVSMAEALPALTRFAEAGTGR